MKGASLGVSPQPFFHLAIALEGEAFEGSMAMELSGAGLGFRRDLIEPLQTTARRPAFLELAPENWMGIGGRWGKILRDTVAQYPVTCHGLSLSLGSPDELNWDFLRQLKRFFNEIPVQVFSEHLSFTSCGNAHLYELLPVPFREDAVRHIVQRIEQVQDFLERQIAIENVSYYTPVAAELSEAEFITAIAEESDCKLLLDVNNVYVNAFNHQYNAKEFISALPLERVAAIHMAGHEQRSAELIIDTHGEAIIDPVFDLFDWTIQKVQPVPVLLERDFNFCNYAELAAELDRLDSIISNTWGRRYAA